MATGKADWRGPFIAITTPFDAQGKIVETDFRILVNSFVNDGATGIIVAGHNGESWALKHGEFERLVRIAVNEAKGRVPILCGVESRDAAGVIEEARSVAGAGAQGIMVEPPYVVTTSTDAEIIDRFERIANDSPVPVMLYNNPRRTQIHVKPETLAKLAKHQNIVALKDASRDFGDLSAKIDLAGNDINIFVGPATQILPGILLGARGFISSGPMELMRRDGFRLYELATQQRVEEAIPLHFLATRIYRMLFGIGTWPAALKAAMNAIGRPAGLPRLPVHPLGPQEEEALKKTLRELGLLQ
jgi:4-hydroxy-tetrahydrodipicolinate synthase